MRLDYSLWGYIKAHVYTDMHASINALEENIEAFRTNRMDHLKRSCGQHLHEVI